MLVRIALFLTYLTCAHAQSAADPKPLLSAVVIDAEQQLQCTKDQRKCSAHGGVTIRKGETELASQDMKVRFTPERTLRSVSAKDHVRFQNEDYQAQADEARYTPHKHLLSTKGRVTVADKHINRQLTADNVDLHFKPSEGVSPQHLEHAHAKGHVTFRTSHELLQAQQASFDKDRNHLSVIGDVVIVRPEGIISGASAQADLQKKIYVMDAEISAKENYVYGVIFPNQSRHQRS